jgi:hypothetical protein
LLNVDSPALQGAKDAEQLLAMLTGGGRPEILRWVNDHGDIAA